VHLGENIAGVTFGSLDQLGVLQKLLAITVDNALNNDTLVKHLHHQLLKQFDDEVDLELGNVRPIMRFRSKQHRIRCIAHVLNLIVGQILSSLKTGTAKEARDFDETKVGSIGPLNGVVKIRLLVLWICKSTQRQQFWDNMTAKIIQFDVDTRWNSTYNMLSDAIRCKAELVRLGRAHPEALGLYTLTTADWSFVEQLYTVLKPFHEFTKLVSSGRPTITTSTGIYFQLSKHLKLAGACEDKYAEYDVEITDAVYGSLELFNKYYNAMDQNLIYYIASVLDLQIKGVWIRSEHQDGNAKLTEVQETICKLYPSMPLRSEPVGDNLPVDPSDNSASDPLQALLAHIHKDNAFTSDVDLYFNTPVVNYRRGGGEDPNWVLNWWRSYEAEYPIMSQVARDYLAIPAGEVDVERLFSTGRDLIGLRRYSLSIDTMRALMMLKSLQSVL
jgi:hypothetical protein